MESLKMIKGLKLLHIATQTATLYFTKRKQGNKSNKKTSCYSFFKIKASRYK